MAISVSDQNSVIDEDIIITMLVLRVWYSHKGRNYFFINHCKQSREQENFIRNSSLDLWSLSAPGPLAMYMNVWEIEG